MSDVLVYQIRLADVGGIDQGQTARKRRFTRINETLDPSRNYANYTALIGSPRMTGSSDVAACPRLGSSRE